MSNINPGPFTTRPEIDGTFGVVTSTHWIGTAVGMSILERGGTSGGEPRVLSDTVRYAFVCDPNGNHIEISQRASLTGGTL